VDADDRLLAGNNSWEIVGALSGVAS
jgi:hypothetical protein